jgi:hypothetical protein
VTYRIKRGAHGTREKVRVMTPLEFLARLSAIIPPPRYPLLRYHGVLAPSSKWRRHVVPKPRESPGTCERQPERRQPTPQERPRDQQPVASRAKTSDSAPRHEPDDARAEASPVASAQPLPPSSLLASALGAGPTLLSPNILSVRHWERLLGGRLLAAQARVDWSTLLRRTFAVDVTQCSNCGGQLRVVGSYLGADLVRAVLEELGMPPEAQVPARARDPTSLFADAGTD